MRIRSWAIGLFLILGIGFFTAILFLIGNRHDFFGKHVEFYSEFSNVGGLMKGAEVRVSGLNAGEVKGIGIPASPASKFRLKLQVEAKARGMVRTDSVVSIETEGVVGNKYVSIRVGTSSAPEAQDGATLPGKEPFDIQALVELRVPRC
jgi:phospholipid/cholesterol/gamma-HCH transport system substrate-binding protein